MTGKVVNNAIQLVRVRSDIVDGHNLYVSSSFFVANEYLHLLRTNQQRHSQ